MKQVFKSHLIARYRLSPEMAEKIATLVTPRRLARGTVLLRQGEIPHHIAFIERGCLRSYVTDKKGKSHTLSFAPEEWWIGDQTSMLRSEPAMFSIDAVEDSEVLIADHSFFEKAPEVFEGFYKSCFIYMLDRLRIMEKRILYLQGAFGDERYLDFLSSYPELAVRLPQYMIASYLGISRQSLSRIRGKLASSTLESR